MIIQDPRALRMACRSGGFTRPTAGHALGYLQANLMIVPGAYASDFVLFCQRNPKPCPLIEVLRQGQREPGCAQRADVATDVPGYRVYVDGQLAMETGNIAHLWRDDLVSFLIGCSFSFEAALLAEGIALRHISMRRNVPMYRTSLSCIPAGVFQGEMVVSMRPIPVSDVDRVIEITSRFPGAHGAPVHVGRPSDIGIDDIARPDYGDAVEVREGEVPVFWACGVTPQWVALKSRIPFCITHAPGKMFVTDMPG